jgi:hypothetical protein
MPIVVPSAKAARRTLRRLRSQSFSTCPNSSSTGVALRHNFLRLVVRILTVGDRLTSHAVMMAGDVIGLGCPVQPRALA